MSTKFTPSDAALDAGVAAWFGVTKVEAEKNFIRSRMRAAVLAVLEWSSLTPAEQEQSAKADDAGGDARCGGREYCGRFPFCACGGPNPLPERDPNRSSERQGLFRKFEVKRTDGSDGPGGKHDGCEYFVLDTRHDKHAMTALAAYATAVEDSHPALASDMRQRYDLAAPTPRRHEVNRCIRCGYLQGHAQGCPNA